MSQSRVTEQDAPPKKRGPGRPRLLEPSPEFVARREEIAAAVIGDVDPRAATHSILGMTFWSYKWFHPGSDDVERLADDCVTLLLGPPARGGRRPAVAKAAPKPGTGTRRKTNR